ncbi:MAG: DUF523 domain-containing protein [Desulfobacula sp.]|nr:DUF523 domain-containing protein [Desulfobacula sp.]MDA8133156.1 DUF523 domain-containing protein [Desulfobacteraceae bacterium]
MEKILISACLAGDRVRYDGRIVPLESLLLARWKEEGRLVKVCPEVAGGMTIPRPPAQITGGSGLDVLRRKARVMDNEGVDVTGFFIRGAEYALSMAQRFGVRLAVLKEKSPSCGVRWIYDGNFTSTLIPGEGVTAALLREHDVLIFSEQELDMVEGILRLE